MQLPGGSSLWRCRGRTALRGKATSPDGSGSCAEQVGLSARYPAAATLLGNALVRVYTYVLCIMRLVSHLCAEIGDPPKPQN